MECNCYVSPDILSITRGNCEMESGTQEAAAFEFGFEVGDFSRNIFKGVRYNIPKIARFSDYDFELFVEVFGDLIETDALGMTGMDDDCIKTFTEMEICLINQLVEMGYIGEAVVFKKIEFVGI